MDVATSFAEKMAKDEKIAGVKRSVFWGQAYIDVEFMFMKDPKAMVELVRRRLETTALSSHRAIHRTT
eukprot:9588761-Lingulodinium_polyedra.AAC.1